MATSCRTGWLQSDPVEMVHEFRDPRDIEVAGLFASSIALGRVASIRARLRDLIDRLDGKPAEVCRSSSPAALARRFQGFRHRFFSGVDLAILAANIGRVVGEHASLDRSWARGACLEEAADQFARAMSAPVKGLKPESRLPLVTSPAGGSTCKRLAMYLRWMVRPADGVDFGIWRSLRPADLVVPLDVHVFRISRLLGLTRRRTANWAAVRSVTAALAALDPEDPVKYDFALSRLGIVYGCKGRWHATICPGCPVREACSAASRRLRAGSSVARPMATGMKLRTSPVSA